MDKRSAVHPNPRRRFQPEGAGHAAAAGDTEARAHDALAGLGLALAAVDADLVVAGDVAAPAPASSASGGSAPGTPAERAAAVDALRAWVGRIKPAAGASPAELAEQAAALRSVLESAGVTTMDLSQPGQAPTLDTAAAAGVRDKLKEAQRALQALGGASNADIPEQDPAVLEQLPPDLRELYRTSGTVSGEITRMDRKENQVCLLIDFENLVRGVADIHGDEFTAENLEPELIFSLAEEYGRVVSARAYADWRQREINQFQHDLYALGIDLVHVLAKHRKNAVDVKLAVDAIETIWELPDVSTFVLVSGDRDFIHVLKALRKRGKQIIGMAPDNAVSDDFAALCDRFVSYAALRKLFADARHDGGSENGDSDLDEVRIALRRLLAREAEGMLGAKIVPALRRELSPTFDVSDYGFQKLGGLLKALPDVVQIQETAGGDLLVTLATQPAKGDAIPLAQVEDLAQSSGLAGLRYEQSCARRRQVLRVIHRCMSDLNTFSRASLVQRLTEEAGDRMMSASFVNSYFTLLWHSRAFLVLPDQEDKSAKDRSLRLADHAQAFPALVGTYEKSVLYKARNAFPELSIAQGVELLGLHAGEEQAADYVRVLLETAGAPLPAGLPVPQLSAEQPERIRAELEAIFDGADVGLSKGRIVSQLRSRSGNGARGLTQTQAEQRFQACVDDGLLEQTMDGVTRVYSLRPVQ